MELFENGIGRPSNEILKKRRNFKIIITVIIAVILVGGSFTAYKLLTSSINGKEKEAVSKCVFPFKQSTCSGTKNDTVKEIQRILCTKGYFANVNTKNCSKETDGYFGTKTTNAIKKFQGKKGLSKDGIVGVSTLKAIAKEGKVDYYTIAYYIANYKGNLNGTQKMDNNGNYQQVVLRGKVQYLTTSKVNTSGYYHVGWKSQRAVSGDTQTLGCYQSSCAWNKQSKYSWISNRNRGIYTLLWQAGQATGGTGSNGQVIRFTPVYCPTSKPEWNYSTSSCTSCPSSRPEYNASTNKCQACPTSRPILDPTNNKCKACPVGSTWNSSKKTCVCGTGATYRPSSNKCVCSEGQKYDTKSKKCVSLCGTGQRYDTKSKKCVSICPEYQKYDTKSKKCVNKCKSGQIYNNGKCLTPMNNNGSISIRRTSAIKAIYYGKDNTWRVSFNGYKPNTNINAKTKVNGKAITEGAVTLYHLEGILGRKPKWDYLLSGKDPKKTYYVSNGGTNFSVIGYRYVTTKYADGLKLTYNTILDGYPVAVKVKNSANNDIYVIAYGLKGGNVSTRDTKKLSPSDVLVYDPSDGVYRTLVSYYGTISALGLPLSCKDFQTYNKARGTCDNKCSGSKPLYKDGKCQACPKGKLYDASKNICKNKVASTDIVAAATKIYKESNNGRKYSYSQENANSLDNYDGNYMNCASFIALTISRTKKFDNFETIAKNYDLSDSTEVGDMLVKLGFEKLNFADKYFETRHNNNDKGFSEKLKVGDIVLWKGRHIQLYIGNLDWYNGGSERGYALQLTQWYDAYYPKSEYDLYHWRENWKSSQNKFRGVYVYRLP